MWVKQAWRFLPALLFLPSSNREIFRGCWRCYSLHTQSSLHPIANYEDTTSTARIDEEMKKEFHSTPRKDFNERNMRLHWKTFQSEDELDWKSRFHSTVFSPHCTSRRVAVSWGIYCCIFSLAAQYLSGIWIVLDEINAWNFSQYPKYISNRFTLR